MDLAPEDGGKNMDGAPGPQHPNQQVIDQHPAISGNSPGENLDLLHRIPNLYRLLDLYCEDGSGGFGEWLRVEGLEGCISDPLFSGQSDHRRKIPR